MLADTHASRWQPIATACGRARGRPPSRCRSRSQAAHNMACRPAGLLNPSVRERSGPVAIMQSACCPAGWTESGPDTAIPMGTGMSGRSNNLVRSTRKCSPLKLT
jgi:hypothetical protein